MKPCNKATEASRTKGSGAETWLSQKLPNVNSTELLRSESSGLALLKYGQPPNTTETADATLPGSDVPAPSWPWGFHALHPASEPHRDKDGSETTSLASKAAASSRAQQLVLGNGDGDACFKQPALPAFCKWLQRPQGQHLQAPQTSIDSKPWRLWLEAPESCARTSSS